MLTDPKLKSQVDQLWDKFWTGGLTNPLDAIEQFSYLLFLKRMDDNENRKQRIAERLHQPYLAGVEADMRWSYWTNLKADEALKYLKEKIFPGLREMGGNGSSFQLYMQNAECKINKGSLLIEACKLIDGMEINQQQQDVQGDLYEYLLSKLNSAGRNGQFRTPRHIIRMMVQMIAPRPKERIGDLAAGTCGFLVNTYQYILETHTSPEILHYDEDGWPHNLIGDKLSEEDMAALKRPEALRGFDNDSGMTMLRIGAMNLMLHGIEAPQFFYQDTLSKKYEQEREYDVILMNPPFKGAVDKDDLHITLQPAGTTKSELLFIHLILRALDMGGRCAVIVPDGVLFGSSRAHVELRRKLVEENRLDGVISMPGGVFKPYAGVSTAVLLFTRGAKTESIWFYDMAADGFSLDDKRAAVPENDIPDILECWKKRQNAGYAAQRETRMAELKEALTPLNAERLLMEAEINRLTFEQVISANGDGPIAVEMQAAKSRLEELQSRLAPLRKEYKQLARQFRVTKEQVKANKYDLSASRYREVGNEEIYYEKPESTLLRLRQLNNIIDSEIETLRNML
ncbi:MAG: N-6 DNA methylase [Chloroflexi bacterium HGW-Chloroflexi-10]|nr:MAG: N-6 DNA methylase [Chloroflexi bacterium HGW-Chloroflexi-10]